MSGESQQVPQSEPDPSVLTTEQLLRVVKAEREITEAQLDTIRQRLDGMDQAAVVLSETVNRTPTDIETAVGHLKELTNKDVNSLREAADKAEAVNQKALEKAEVVAKESGTGAAIQITGLEQRVSRIEDRSEGGKEVKASQQVTIGIVGAVIGIILGLLTLNTLRNDAPSEPTPIVVEVTVVSPG